MKYIDLEDVLELITDYEELIEEYQEMPQTGCVPHQLEIFKRFLSDLNGLKENAMFDYWNRNIRKFFIQ